MNTDPGQHQATLDRKEWEAVYEEYGKRIYRFAVGLLRDRTKAEDVLQETFLRAYCQSFAEAKGRAVQYRWLATTAYHLVIDEIRVSKRMHFLPDESEDFCANQPLAPCSDPLIVREIQRALSFLDPEDRALLLLRFAEGLDYSEIASILNVCEGTLRSRSSRLCLELRKTLSVWHAGGEI